MVNREYKYLKLNPQDNIDNDQNLNADNYEYFKAIQQGIRDKEVSNIALTGPYGSGKSSILKTFKNKNKQYKFLNISLASFNEAQDKIKSNDNEENNNSEKSTEGKKKKEDNENNISNLIQESILKQIFYQVESEKIPFSRFKRINNKKVNSFVIDIALFSLWVICFFILFKPDLINPVLSPILTSEFINQKTPQFILSISFLVLSFFLLYKLYFLIYTKIKFMRIKFLDTELELNTVDDSSALSRNSDELLYLFEVTDYKVVIIEDLDRFENIDVFTKLRELNEMLNNADNINRNINFVYALRDDLFNKFSDRLKFFDMIIPVVPIVNSTNSANQMNSIIEKYDIELEKSFINKISSYISDMRLIKNIFNEFNIYSSSLDSELDKEDLFSVITYKNKFPKDFSSSLKGNGLIYHSFDRKRELIIEDIKSIQEKIDSKNERLEKTDDELIKNIEELRLICGSQILAESGGNVIGLNNNNSFRKKLDKNNEYKLEEFITDNIFNKFLESKNIYSLTRHKSGNADKNVTISRSEILKSINYKKRKQIVEAKNIDKKEKIKKQIKKLKEDKEYIRDCSFSNYYNEFSSSKFFDDDKTYIYNDLLKFLLINGYIKENTYENYISYLDSSNMTTKDIKFIMKVLSGQNLDYSYELTKIGKIVERLNSDTFSKKVILNYDLLDYLIKKKDINDRYNNYFEFILKQLGGGNEKSINFIEGFINFSEENIIKDFINKLAKTWGNYWYYILKESNYTFEEKKKHLIWSLKYVDIDDIISLNKDEVLTKYIEEQSDIINISVENDIVYKTKEVLEKLKVKFTKIDLNLVKENNNLKKDLFYYIYENNLYKVNIPMVSNIIKNVTLRKNIKEEIETKNYTTILKYQVYDLNEYLKENINQYIEEVFLNLDRNKEEIPEALVKLLNFEDLNLENKERIIDLSKNKIINLKEVNSVKVCEYLFKTNMVKSNWINILAYYKKLNKELNNVIVNFINQKKHYQQLKDLNPNSKNLNNVIGENEVLLFIKNLFENNDISINAAQKIVGSINWQYEELSFKSMNEKVLKLLIKEKVLLFSLTTYNELKLINNLNNIHISLLESNEKEFLNNIPELSFEKQDIIEILNSNKLGLKVKEEIINTIDFNILLNINSLNPDNLEQILDLLNDLGSRVKILTKYVSKLDFEEITKMLKTIGGDYSELTNLRKRPKLNNDNYNSGLLKALKEKGYISSFSLDKDNKVFNVVNRYPNGGDK